MAARSRVNDVGGTFKRLLSDHPNSFIATPWLAAGCGVGPQNGMLRSALTIAIRRDGYVLAENGYVIAAGRHGGQLAGGENGRFLGGASGRGEGRRVR